MTDTIKSHGQQHQRPRGSSPPATNDWKVAIELGPDSDLLYIKLLSRRQADANSANLPAQIQKLLGQLFDEHLVHRVVLQLDEIRVLDARLIHALVELHREIHARGGIMRISGLDPTHERILRHAGVEDRFPRYVNHDFDARGAEKPRKPR